MDESVQKHLKKIAGLDETGRTLLRAAAIIDKLGHCNTGAQGSDGSVCVLQAIGRASDDENVVREASWRLVDLVGFPAYEWNDKPERTKAEVMAVLTTAAFMR